MNQINTQYSILLIIIAVVLTFLLRAIPFVLFRDGKSMPLVVKKVSNVLPPAIIAVLLVYCLKNEMVVVGETTVSAIVAVAVVVMLHMWKRNTLLSVFVGTAVYMIGINIMK